MKLITDINQPTTDTGYPKRPNRGRPPKPSNPMPDPITPLDPNKGLPYKEVPPPKVPRIPPVPPT